MDPLLSAASAADAGVDDAHLERALDQTRGFSSSADDLIDRRATRDWKATDGAIWKVTLETVPRHLSFSVDRRRILTFEKRQARNPFEKVRFVPEDFDLDAASDAALDTLLRAW